MIFNVCCSDCVEDRSSSRAELFCRCEDSHSLLAKRGVLNTANFGNLTLCIFHRPSQDRLSSITAFPNPNRIFSSKTRKLVSPSESCSWRSRALLLKSDLFSEIARANRFVHACRIGSPPISAVSQFVQYHYDSFTIRRGLPLLAFPGCAKIYIIISIPTKSNLHD